MLPDIAWSELAIIAMIALIVVGPKDLPRMLRSLGKAGGYVRGLADDFRRGFQELEREADRQDMLEESQRRGPAAFAKPVDPTGPDLSGAPADERENENK